MGSHWRVPFPGLQPEQSFSFYCIPAWGLLLALDWWHRPFSLSLLAIPLFLSEAVHRPFVLLACIAPLGSPQPDGVDPVGPGRDGEGHHTNCPPPLVPLFTGHLKAILRPLGTDAQEDGIGLWERAGRKWGGSQKWPLAVPWGPCWQSECRSSARLVPEPEKQGRLLNRKGGALFSQEKS